jgi:hypothetical protein
VELEAYASSQGASQANGYGVLFRDWKGTPGAEIADPANYEVTKDAMASLGPITETWSALIENRSSSPQSSKMSKSTTVLGLEVSGTNQQQEIDIRPGKVLNGRNEIRIGDHGKIQLTNSELKSDRWVDIQAGGVLTGQGKIHANVYNSGTIKPGFDGTVASPTPSTPGGDFAVAMDFSAIDNRASKDAFYTPLMRAIDQAVISLDYGPSAGSRLTDRGFNDFANEFNLQNWSVGGTLQNAIVDNAFVSLTVNPVEGLSVELRSAAFDFWRNGNNSPSQYAILTNLDGLTADSALASTSVTTSGAANTTRFQANGTTRSTLDQLAVRLYGWGAGNANGHTHLTGAELNLRFSTVMEIPLRPAGRLDIEGDLFHTASSTIEMGIGGFDNSNLFIPQFDFIDVAGEANLMGRLKLFSQDGFAINENALITLLTASSITGTFSSVEAIGFGEYAVSLEYGSHSVSARFFAVPEPNSAQLVIMLGVWMFATRRRRF